MSAALLAAGPALGAPPPVSPEAVCVTTPQGARVVDPLRLTRWLVEHAGLSDATLDADGDGDTLLAEKVRALSERGYCAAPGRACAEGDAAALAGLQQDLVEFVQSGGGAAFAFRRLGRGEVEEAAPGGLSVAEVLDPEGRFVRMVCTAAEPPPAPRPPEGEPAWVWDLGLEDGLRLAGDIDDLSKDRQRLYDVKAAELSVNSDLRGGRTSWHVNAVLGYVAEVSRGERAHIANIPFVAYERFFDGTDDEIDRLGLGVQQATTLKGSGIGIQQVAVTGLYTTDSDFEADIASLKFRWTPLLPEPAPVPLGFYADYGPVQLKLGLDGLADAGRVFEAGDNEDLEDHQSFLRAGGRLSLSIRGGRATVLERFELTLTNKHLYNVGADINHVNRFEAALSYLLPQRENYKLSLSYVNGRADDTLERIEFWKTQLGIRF